MNGIQLWLQATLQRGDSAGHIFHGNQYKAGSAGAEAHVDDKKFRVSTKSRLEMMGFTNPKDDRARQAIHSHLVNDHGLKSGRLDRLSHWDKVNLHAKEHGV